MKNMVRNILCIGCLSISILISACKDSKDDPATAAKAFYEALARKDFDEAALFATKDSKTILELIKSMNEMGAGVGTGNEDFEKLKTAVYTNDHSDGDKATVKVKIGEEENIIRLKKEDGAWKVAFDKESLKETIRDNSNETGEQLREALDNAASELNNLDDSIDKALEETGNAPKSDSVK
jgi:hypothetical protein